MGICMALSRCKNYGNTYWGSVPYLMWTSNHQQGTFPLQTAGYERDSQEAMIFLPCILFWNISDILMFCIAIFSQRDEIYGSWGKYLEENWQNYVFFFLIKFLINSELRTSVNNTWVRIKLIETVRWWMHFVAFNRYQLCYKSQATSSDLHASPARLPWYIPAGSQPVPFIREMVHT